MCLLAYIRAYNKVAVSLLTKFAMKINLNPLEI